MNVNGNGWVTEACTHRHRGRVRAGLGNIRYATLRYATHTYGDVHFSTRWLLGQVGYTRYSHQYNRCGWVGLSNGAVSHGLDGWRAALSSGGKNAATSTGRWRSEVREQNVQVLLPCFCWLASPGDLRRSPPPNCQDKHLQRRLKLLIQQPVARMLEIV